MKLVILLALVACSYAAKLDRTYLPPPGASSAGGSPGSLNAPLGAPSGSTGFGRTPTSFGKGAVGSQSSFSQPAYQGSNQPGFGEDNQGFEQNQGSVQQNFVASPGLSPFQQNAGQTTAQNFGSDFQPAIRAQAAADRSAEILRSTNENDGETFAYSFETSNGISAEENGIATNGVQAQGAFSYMGDDGEKYSVTYTADENGYQPSGEHLPTSPPIPEEILRSIERNAAAAAAGTQEGSYQEEESGSGLSQQQYNASPSAQQYNAPSSEQQYNGPASSPNSAASNQQYGSPVLNNQYRESSPALMSYSQGPQRNYNPTAGASNGFAPSSAAVSRSNSLNFAPSGPSSSIQSVGGTNLPGYSYSAPSSQSLSTYSQSGATPSLRRTENTSTGPKFGPTTSFQPAVPAVNQPQPSKAGPRSQYSPSAPALSNQLNRAQIPTYRQPALQQQDQDDQGYRYDRPASTPQNNFRGNSATFSASFGTPAGSMTFGARPSSSQESFAPQTSFGRTNSPSLKSVAPQFGGRPDNKGQQATNSARTTDFGFGPSQSSLNRQPTSPSNGFQATGPAAGQGAVSAPRQYSSQQGASPRTSTTEYQSAPYQYNAPRTQGQNYQSTSVQQSAPAVQQPGSFNQGNLNAPRSQMNFNGPRGQNFAGPQQPPSFSPEEGYKY